MGSNKNGFEIQVSKESFFQKSTDEKLWMLFEGVINLNVNGCDFGKRHYKAEKYIKLKLVGVGFAVAIPVIYILAKIFIPWCP